MLIFLRVLACVFQITMLIWVLDQGSKLWIKVFGCIGITAITVLLHLVIAFVTIGLS